MKSMLLHTLAILFLATGLSAQAGTSTAGTPDSTSAAQAPTTGTRGQARHHHKAHHAKRHRAHRRTTA